MISSLDPSTQGFLNNLRQINQEMQQAQAQLSTGLRVNQASDAPDEISAILQARASLSQTQQINTNLGMFNTEVNAGQQALQNAIQIFDQVQTLGAQGDSSTASAATRSQLAQQVNNILQQMVGLADTQNGGRYIFAGDTDQQQPYTIDMTQTPPAVSAYQGSNTTRHAQHPDGSTFPVALTAQTIFDSPAAADNVFTSMKNLSAALSSNNDTAIQTAVSVLSQVGDYLNQQLAFYGTAQQNVQQATDYGQTMVTQLQAQISNLEDADSAAAIEQLTQAQTQDQAALQSQAMLPRTTLFNFLG